jgi:hypothetical protein
MKKIMLLSMLCAFVANCIAQNPVIKLPHYPRHIVVNSKDELIFVCDDSLMKITTGGKLSTIVKYPGGVEMAIDKNDNIYCAGDRKITKVTANGKIENFAGYNWTAETNDGPLDKAGFDAIGHIAIDAAGNIYIVELRYKNNGLAKNFLFRKITKDKTVKTVLATGENTDLQYLDIAGFCLDSIGNIYITTVGNRCIKKISPDGKVTTIAGMCNKRKFMPVYIQGDISKAELYSPGDIVINKKGEVIFLDNRLHRLIKVANNQVSTLAGNSLIQINSLNIGGRSQEGYKDGKALSALFNFADSESAIEIDSKQNIYILDAGNNCIRKLSVEGMVTTVALFNPKEYKRY